MRKLFRKDDCETSSCTKYKACISSETDTGARDPKRSQVDASEAAVRATKQLKRLTRKQAQRL